MTHRTDSADLLSEGLAVTIQICEDVEDTVYVVCQHHVNLKKSGERKVNIQNVCKESRKKSLWKELKRE